MNNLLSGMGVIPNKTNLCKSEPKNILYHYTSLEVMWLILKNEQIRATQATFSNDSEEIITGLETINEIFKEEEYKFDINDLDRYIFCLCAEGDKLSQWRGYCSLSGVSIGLGLDDFNTGEDQSFQCYINDKMYRNLNVYPVYYLANEDSFASTCYTKKILSNELISKFNEIKKYESNESVLKETILSVVPYIKHSGFFEEEEYRVIVGGVSDELIEYHDDATCKIKKPYVNLTFKLKENINNEKLIITFFYKEKNALYDQISIKLKELNTKYKIVEILQDNLNEDCKIILSYTNDQEQEECFKIVDNKINTDNKYTVPIWCLGHLPVRKIIVSPSVNQEMIINSIKHFCYHHKYWMKYIKVEASKIPYRRPISN